MILPKQTHINLNSQQTKQTQSQSQSQSQSMKSSLATASAIARDSSHPKREQAEELVRAFQRGWIDSTKFNEILQQLVF